MVNKVILIGNLGKDPELRFTPSGRAVCKFSLATSEKWADQQTGEKKEKTSWHNIVVWGKSAENCGQYLAKGRQVYIEGSIHTRSWDDNGVTKYITEIVARNVQFLGGGAERTERIGATAPAGEDQMDQRAGSDIDDSDIPF